MGVELNLPWTVKNNERVVCKLRNVVYKVINMLYQILHAVDQTTVGSIVHQLLHIIKGYHVANIEVTPVLEDLCCWVKINYLKGPLVCISDLLESVAQS